MFLDAIRQDVDERIKRLLPIYAYWRDQAERMPPVRSLKAALTQGARLQVIAECKQKSPSKGWLTDGYDPVAQARQYERDGAAAISVLTEPHYFAGDMSHLEAVRSAVGLPVLRKDFVRHPVQLYEARARGADAALLIVRILDDVLLGDLMATAEGIGLEVLVEVHAVQELERALRQGATIVGVNNRDLDTFETRLEFSRELSSQLPAEVVAVSESGIRTTDDMALIESWGYRAVLIGETLMRGTNVLEAWTHASHR
ncbi:MAG: indole-3-glycerol phosphate synthase TrpC [Firmicutes bacterium]|nr:indole-3-glycerol phosphate synthase TrpC [Bacillota bacterium]